MVLDLVVVLALETVVVVAVVLELAFKLVTMLALVLITVLLEAACVTEPVDGAVETIDAISGSLEPTQYA